MKLRIGIQLTTVSVFVIVTLFVSLVAIGLWPEDGKICCRECLSAGLGFRRVEIDSRRITKCQCCQYSL